MDPFSFQELINILLFYIFHFVIQLANCATYNLNAKAENARLQSLQFNTPI